MSDDNERPTPAEAGRAGCEMVLLIVLLVVMLLAFGPVMMMIAPLDQVGQNDNQVQQIGR